MTARAGVLGAVALACLGLSAVFSARLADVRTRPDAAIGPGAAGDLLVQISRRPAFALGFRDFFGDLVWLDAVQVAGNRKMTAAQYDRLVVLLDAVSNYAPRFEIPYLAGGVILGESPSHARDAIRVLERGRVHFPDDWRLPFYIGFTQYFSLGDAKAGGGAIAAASRLPDSPAYLAGLSARMLAEGNDPETALELLVAMERQETDKRRKEALGQRIRETIVERDILLLERRAARYREMTGKPPATLEDLVSSGLLAALPREPFGGRYLILADGTVRSDRVRERLRVHKK